jgi:hypothetical protein
MEPDVLHVITHVPRARVSVRLSHAGSDPEPEPLAATCDDRGDAAVPLPAHPEFLMRAFVEATAEGFRKAEACAQCDERRVELQLRPESEEAPAANAKGTLEVSGRVAFPDGRPVPGAEMELPTPGGYASTTAGADGEYRFEGQHPGPVTVECPCSGETRAVEAGSAGVDFTVKAHVVQVRFVDRKGRPFRWVVWRHEVWSGGKKVDEGRSLGGLSADRRLAVPTGATLKISAAAPFYPFTVASLDVEGPPAFHDLPVVIEKVDVPGTIAVRISTDTGKPPTRVSLTAWNDMGDLVGHAGIEGEVKVAADGRVLIEGLPAGKVTVEANTQREQFSQALVGDYGLPAAVEAVAEAGKTIPVDLVVPLGGRLSLTVRGPDGAIVAAGDARIRDEKGEVIDVPFWIRDEDGSWSTPSKAAPALLYHPVPPGPYTLEVLRDEAVVASKRVAVVPGETLEVEIRLEK